jgi:hypothetical protein
MLAVISRSIKAGDFSDCTRDHSIDGTQQIASIFNFRSTVANSTSKSISCHDECHSLARLQSSPRSVRMCPRNHISGAQKSTDLRSAVLAQCLRGGASPHRTSTQPFKRCAVVSPLPIVLQFPTDHTCQHSLCDDVSNSILRCHLNPRRQKNKSSAFLALPTAGISPIDQMMLLLPFCMHLVLVCFVYWVRKFAHDVGRLLSMNKPQR